MTTLHLRKSRGRSPLRLGFLLIPLALAWFALSPTVRAVDPPPDGGYPLENTAEGTDALFSLTGGTENTAVGSVALYYDTAGAGNTAIGASTLLSNTSGNDNTAIGVLALFSNTLGNHNTASGDFALYSNTSGDYNTADGHFTLFHNTTGASNTATGHGALYNNTTGSNNTADGYNALLKNTTGSFNISVGNGAGGNLTTGIDNIDIGSNGVAGESKTIRIGTKHTQKTTFIAGISGATVAGGVTVIVDANGQLSAITSSERFKEDMKPMDKASEAILALKPVTFRYKHELDPAGIPQFGLVAEQVEKVNPDLVARDEQGNPYTVRYEAVNAMLLNEFLKEHRKVEEQARKEQELETTIAQQQRDFQATAVEQEKEIKALTASLKEQASQIQKVSDKVEMSRPAPQMVGNNQ